MSAVVQAAWFFNDLLLDDGAAVNTLAGDGVDSWSVISAYSADSSMDVRSVRPRFPRCQPPRSLLRARLRRAIDWPTVGTDHMEAASEQAVVEGPAEPDL